MEGGKKLTVFTDIPPETALWNNPTFEQLEAFENSTFWEQKKVTTIGQIYDKNTIRPYENLCKQYNRLNRQFYKYLQLRHVLQAQFGGEEFKISKYPFIGILKTQGSKGLISKQYSHLFQSKICGEPEEI